MKIPYLTEVTKMAKSRTLYLCKATFTGQGSFPLDMLRYDQCWLVKEGTINSSETISFYDYEKYRLIQVEKFSPVQKIELTWTLKRWESFNWYLAPAVSKCAECLKRLSTNESIFLVKSGTWVHHLCAK